MKELLIAAVVLGALNTIAILWGLAWLRACIADVSHWQRHDREESQKRDVSAISRHYKLADQIRDVDAKAEAICRHHSIRREGCLCEKEREAFRI